eukprot:IDg6482t1
MSTDSKILFELVKKVYYTAEKRLLIDVAVIREAFRELETDSIGQVLSEHNPADSITKLTYGTQQKILTTEKLDHLVQQWSI